MGLLLSFMSTELLHEGACSCLTEIVLKRMDPASKLEHLARLQIVSLLSQAHASGIEITVGFASLVSAMVLEILESWDKIRSRSASDMEANIQANQASEQLRGVMPLLLSCLSSEDIEVGCATALLRCLEIPPELHLRPYYVPVILVAGVSMHSSLSAFLCGSLTQARPISEGSRGT